MRIANARLLITDTLKDIKGVFTHFFPHDSSIFYLGILGDMSITQLHIFSVKRDATAAMRGYEFQKLKTLETWLRNRMELNDEMIYCDYEEDIYQHNAAMASVKFRQIKLYAKNFKFSSPEIAKSLCSFFMLYVNEVYQDKAIQFIFEANSTSSKNTRNPENAFFIDWIKQQESLSYELLARCQTAVKQIVTNYIDERQQKLAKRKDMRDALMQARLFYDQLDDAHWHQFIAKIRWKFDDTSPAVAMASLNTRILEMLARLPYQLTEAQQRSVLGSLYLEVAQRSIAEHPQARQLHMSKIDHIILSNGPEDDRNYAAAVEKVMLLKGQHPASHYEFLSIVEAAEYCAGDERLHQHRPTWMEYLSKLLEERFGDYFHHQRLRSALLLIYFRTDFFWRDQDIPGENIGKYAPMLKDYFKDLSYAVTPDDINGILYHFNNAHNAWAVYPQLFSENDIDQFEAELRRVIAYRFPPTPNSISALYYHELMGRLEFTSPKGPLSVADLDKMISHYWQVVHYLPCYPIYNFLHFYSRIYQDFNILLKLQGNAHDHLVDVFCKFFFDLEPTALKMLEKELVADQYQKIFFHFYEAEGHDAKLKSIRFLQRCIGLYIQQEVTYFKLIYMLLSGAKVYHSLGLNYAARYMAFSAMPFCMSATHDLVEELAHCYDALFHICYNHGALSDAFHMAKEYMKHENHYEKKRSGGHPKVRQIIHGLLQIVRMARVNSEELQSHYSGKMVLPYEWVKIYEEEVKEVNKDFNNRDAIIAYHQDHFNDYAFNDTEELRGLRWQLGQVRWRVYCRNEHRMVSIAEEFVSLLQLIQGEFLTKRIDLKINMATISVYTYLVEPGKQDHLFTQDMEKPTSWHITLLDEDMLNDIQTDKYYLFLLNSAIKLLNSVSCLSTDDFNYSLEKIRFHEMSKRILIKDSYQQLFRQFYPADLFNEIPRTDYGLALKDMFRYTYSASTLSTAPGKKSLFNADYLNAEIASIYKNIPVFFGEYWPELQADSTTVQNIHYLNCCGWTDWQILLTLFNLLIHHACFSNQPTIWLLSQGHFTHYTRIHHHQFQIQPSLTVQEGVEEILEFLGNEIMYDKAFHPAALLATPLFGEYLLSSCSFLLPLYGLSNKIRNPNLKSLRRFLMEHYGFHHLDQLHGNPLKPIGYLTVPV